MGKLERKEAIDEATAAHLLGQAEEFVSFYARFAAYPIAPESEKHRVVINTAGDVFRSLRWGCGLPIEKAASQGEIEPALLWVFEGQLSGAETMPFGAVYRLLNTYLDHLAERDIRLISKEQEEQLRGGLDDASRAALDEVGLASIPQKGLDWIEMVVTSLKPKVAPNS